LRKILRKLHQVIGLQYIYLFYAYDFSSIKQAVLLAKQSLLKPDQLQVMTAKMAANGIRTGWH